MRPTLYAAGKDSGTLQLKDASAEQILNNHLGLAILNLFPGIVVAASLALVAPAIFARRQASQAPANMACRHLGGGSFVHAGTAQPVLMRTGGAFWNRYCITSALTFYMLVVVVLAA